MAQHRAWGQGQPAEGRCPFSPGGGPELHPETLSRESMKTLLLSLYYFLSPRFPRSVLHCRNVAFKC